MGNKYKVTQSNPGGDAADRAQFQIDQAAERRRRGFVAFTRKDKQNELEAVRDAGVAGDSQLGTVRGVSQRRKR